MYKKPEGIVDSSLKKQLFILKQDNVKMKREMNLSTTDFTGKQKSRNELWNRHFKEPLKKDQTLLNCTPLSPSYEDSNLSLCEMLQEYMIENENLRCQNLELIQIKEKLEKDHENIKTENDKLSKEINKLISTSKSSTDIKRKNTQCKATCTINFSYSSTIENSYVKLHEIRKKNFISLINKRDSDDTTKLSPTNLSSDKEIISFTKDIYLKNHELQKDISKLENQIKVFQNYSTYINFDR